MTAGPVRSRTRRTAFAPPPHSRPSRARPSQLSHATTALPAAGFTVPATGIHGLDPAPARTSRSPPAEGRDRQPHVIDTLVAGAVDGDARARDELLALIHPLVLKYCRARLGRQESLMGSADDVAQDVCMAVVSALPNYQLKGLSFRAFVYGIAAHKVTDAFRAIGRNRTEPVADLPDGPVTADGPEHRAARRRDVRAAGRRCSAHLTPRQREVLVLRLAVGLSAEETAQAVRSTPGAVRVTQHRALGRLRRSFWASRRPACSTTPTTGRPRPRRDGGPTSRPTTRALDAMAAFLDGRVPDAGRPPSGTASALTRGLGGRTADAPCSPRPSDARPRG